MGKPTYVEFAQVRKGDDGSTYIKIVEDVTLSKNDKVYKNTPEEKLKTLLDRGFIDEATAAERLSRTPKFILQILTVKKEG
ncbi:hypothetical protein N9K75_02155 [bacterium]|nr:hypothetical protein [bacterium]